MIADMPGEEKTTKSKSLPPIDLDACIEFWKLEGQAQTILLQARPIIIGVLDRVGIEFYDYFSADPTACTILADPATRQRAIAGMLSYWDGLFSQDMATAIGRAQKFAYHHYEQGVSPRLFLAGCYQVLSLITGALLAEHGQNALPLIDCVTRAVMMTTEVGLSAYFDNVTHFTTQDRLDHETRSLQEKVRSLEEMAYVDGLTWLFNRRYFDLALAAEIARADRQQVPLALLIVDVDHFKHINDTYGHDAGDRVLCQVSEIIRQSARRSDIVARFGGEEFTLILPGTARDAALQVAERLRHLIEETTLYLGDDRNEAQAVRMTVSGGLAALGPNRTAQDLIKEADRALYRAKETGRNRIMV